VYAGDICVCILQQVNAALSVNYIYAFSDGNRYSFYISLPLKVIVDFQPF